MKVNILELQKDGTQRVVLVCSLSKNGVELQGDKALIEDLTNNGIRSPKSQIVFPKDGEIFLRSLKHHFRSGYLNATGII